MNMDYPWSHADGCPCPSCGDRYAEEEERLERELGEPDSPLHDPESEEYKEVYGEAR